VGVIHIDLPNKDVTVIYIQMRACYLLWVTGASTAHNRSWRT
jgi:hypothetical protein